MIRPSYGDTEEVRLRTQDFNDYLNAASQEREILSNHNQQQELEQTKQWVKTLVSELEKKLKINETSIKDRKRLEKILQNKINEYETWAQSKAKQFLTLNKKNFDALYHTIVKEYSRLKSLKKNRFALKDTMIKFTKTVLEQSKVIEALTEAIEKLKGNAAEHKHNELENVTGQYLHARATILTHIKDKIFDAFIEKLSTLYHETQVKSLNKALTPLEGSSLLESQEGFSLSAQDPNMKTLKASLGHELRNKIKRLEENQSKLSPETMTKFGSKIRAQEEQRLKDMTETKENTNSEPKNIQIEQAPSWESYWR
ncbi:hypothetical protein [Holospora curviuscula]|uniref:hypothetical protein n=1 Tax=Holospora curviuscula TaxID=1082868 RepID=UPI0013FD976B|nr:hypothetical protein [Holospora curviuscula]